MLKTSFFFGLLRKKGNKFVKEKGKNTYNNPKNALDKGGWKRDENPIAEGYSSIIRQSLFPDKSPGKFRVQRR